MVYFHFWAPPIYVAIAVLGLGSMARNNPEVNTRLTHNPFWKAFVLARPIIVFAVCYLGRGSLMAAMLLAAVVSISVEPGEIPQGILSVTFYLSRFAPVLYLYLSEQGQDSKDGTELAAGQKHYDIILGSQALLFGHVWIDQTFERMRLARYWWFWPYYITQGFAVQCRWWSTVPGSVEVVPMLLQYVGHWGPVLLAGSSVFQQTPFVLQVGGLLVSFALSFVLSPHDMFLISMMVVLCVALGISLANTFGCYRNRSTRRSTVSAKDKQQ